MSEQYHNPQPREIEVGAIDTQPLSDHLGQEFEDTRQRLIDRGHSLWPSDEEVYDEMRDYYYQCIVDSPLREELFVTAVVVGLENEPIGGDVVVSELASNMNRGAFEFSMGLYFGYVHLLDDLVAKQFDVDECERLMKPELLTLLPGDGYSVPVDWLKQQGQEISLAGRFTFEVYRPYWEPVLHEHGKILTSGGDTSAKAEEGIGHAIKLIGNCLGTYVAQFNYYNQQQDQLRLKQQQEELNKFRAFLNNVHTVEDFGWSE